MTSYKLLILPQTTMPMDRDIQVLQEVQEWDKEIYLLRGTLEEIPSELAEINQEVERERASLQKLQEELKGFQLKQKEKEKELAAKEENIRKYDAQLAQVKTNKEYASLQTEIRSLKADNSLLEEAIINMIDQVEAFQERTEEQKRKVAAAEALLNQKKQEFEEKSKTIREKIEVLTKQKKEKIKEVNPEIALLYERIVTKKHGWALVKVEGEVCPACQIQLRPQVVNEAKLKERIIVCDNCSRILYSV